MKSNEIEETGGKFGPVAIRALAVGAQSMGAIAACALAIGAVTLGIVAIGRLGHRPRENQATRNRRAKGDAFARDRLNDHPATTGTLK